MTPLTRRMFKRLGTTLAAVGILVTLSAAPASASSMYGNYYNPFKSGSYEGNYGWIDCGTCPDDHAVTVSNVRNGYHVWARLQAEVGGVFYTYLDKLVQDGYSGKWKVPSTMPKVRIRFVLCYYNSNYDYVGGCQYIYGYHSK